MPQNYSLNWLWNDLQKALSGLQLDADRLSQVLEIAYRFHDGQFREQKEEEGVKRVPYITHPVGVAKICVALWQSADLDESLEDILAAALTHDLLEDTTISLEELAEVVSPRTIELVQVLTKPLATNFSNRSARNRAFLTSISDAGSAAKYVKVCDSIHNLSRPDSMPVSLLKKSIQKAKRDYLPLTIDPNFKNEIRQSLQRAVDRAQEALDGRNDSNRFHKALEDFLGYCVARAAGKVLEAHDVIDIILELPGLSMVYEGTISDFEGSVLCGWLEPTQRASKSNSLTERLLASGEIVLTGKGFSRATVETLEFQKVFLLPIENAGRDLRHRTFLVVGCDTSKSFSWVSGATLRASIAILTERQRERDARELADYSEWVAKSGLDIEPRKAAALHLSPEQIDHLSRLLDAARVEIGGVLAAVDLMGRSLRRQGGILLVEHRIKDAHSAARKLVERGKGEWESLDDIVGVRVVLLNDNVVRSFVRDFQAQSSNPRSLWNSDIGLIPESVDIASISSVGGYQATHIRFRVKNALEKVGEVACELQVRTVFQDAWARLAHEVQYKSKRRIPKQFQRTLKELSRMCDEANQVANRLTE